MSEARFIVGDVFEEMAKMSDNSVDLIVTSPPFLALRSYLPADHPDKGKEIGSEPTPAAFLTTLLALTREWRRILTPTGSLCVELGDTYSGSGGAGGDYNTGGLREGQPTWTPQYARTAGSNSANGSDSAAVTNAPSGSPRSSSESRMGVDAKNRGNTSKGTARQQRENHGLWPLDKSLCLIPSLFAGSLAYGRNLLDPDDLLEPWRVRNLIVWHRPNPPVGALGDKVRPSTSYVTVACTAKDRWFDLDSERGPGSPNTHARLAKGVTSRPNDCKVPPNGSNRDTLAIIEGDGGAPPLDAWFEDRLAQSDEPHDDAPDADVWTIPTAPYAGSHYATFPPALPRRLINLMAPRQVCTSCGEPRRRITSEPEYVQSATGVERSDLGGKSWHDHTNREFLGNAKAVNGRDQSVMRRTETLGWSDCGHNTWRRGIVCDPFCGSGTTLQAASELGRDSIGIDLDRRNLELARQRLGMFLVEDEVPA